MENKNQFKKNTASEENIMVDWCPNSMIEVSLNHPDDFLKIKETLTRIGIPSKKSNTLFQSCHILHKQRRYFIVHFKELFLLDGKASNFSIIDLKRRNTIISLLNQWELLSVVDLPYIQNPENLLPLHQIKIIPFSDKVNWNLESKYSIGNVKFNRGS